MRVGRSEGGGRRRCIQAACRGGLDCRLGAGHLEHIAHFFDAGGVEAAQRLVERRCALPSREEGIRCGARSGPQETGGPRATEA